jgi:hypothetical protein
MAFSIEVVSQELINLLDAKNIPLSEKKVDYYLRVF